MVYVSLTSDWWARTGRGEWISRTSVLLSLSGVCRYGLAWNPVKTGQVLGASEDMTVCHWCVITSSVISARL